MKFITPNGVGEGRGGQPQSRECYAMALRGKNALESLLIELLDLRDEAQVNEPAEDLISIPLCESDSEKVIQIGFSLDSSTRQNLTQFLQDNTDVFAWAPADMPGIDPEISTHRLGVDPTCRPVKQKRRHFALERRQAIKEELSTPKDRSVDRRHRWSQSSELHGRLFGYNQIRMYESDIPKTSFVTDQGTYCYRVMPFGLKNAGATYQRLVNKLFKEQIGRNMEVYVDDMLVKSRSAKDHVSDLKETFQVLKEHNMKLNPTKCTFGDGAGKFLGFMVSQRGIEANPEKIKALVELTPPKTIREVQRLTEMIAALGRFVSKSAERCLPFFNAQNQQKPIYYVSKVLHDAEIRYQRVEKLAYALIMAAGKLRPLEIKAQVLADFVAECTIPRQTTASEIVQAPVAEKITPGGQVGVGENEPVRAEVGEADQNTSSDGPHWEVYVDGSSSKTGCGADLILTGPEDFVLDYALRFRFRASNNEAEYEALIAGMNLAAQTRAERLKVYCDSLLVANQIQGAYPSVLEMPPAKRCHIHSTGNPRRNLRRTLGGQGPRHQDLKIEQRFTSVAHPQTNGQTEFTNRILLQGIKKRLDEKAGRWAEELYHVLWVYRTTPLTITGESPFNLSFGTEAVIPVDIGVPSPRVTNFNEPFNEDGLRANLDLLEEVREESRIRVAAYKQKVFHYHDMRVRSREFRAGDLVLRKAAISQSKKVGKLSPTWEGPCRVKGVIRQGSYKLETLGEHLLPHAWNSKNLKKYYQ
ncbi:uncharacterized protein LOC143883090 [Tasmannia lanceolata]|uniref:uncharacterized protein LOC143883090 n=1 Tax=Tasmannia lanceolata TaxID=3420 RepID=UPI00406424F3